MGYAAVSKQQFNSSFRVFDATASTPTEVEFTNTEQEDYCLVWRENVEDITDLPVFYKHGAVVRVTNSPDSGRDDYYVEFATSAWRDNTGSDEAQFDAYGDRFGRGNWRETSARDEASAALDSATMPHRLGRNSVGTWTYSRVDWESRSAGDDLTSPNPSFVDGRLTEIFFYENRLGLASDANIILSESSEPESFYRTTVLSLPPSDPIDVGLSRRLLRVRAHCLRAPSNQRS